MAARQLPLDLPHTESRARSDFLEGETNRQALALIDAWPAWPAPAMALVGPPGAGKSHLAALLAARAGANPVSAVGLTAEQVPGALAGGLAVIEDIDRAPLDEAALFHLLNLAREQGASVLLTARETPASLAARLATRDLASRLRAVPVVEIAAPDDVLLGAIALKLFADRQIVPDEGLVGFILLRIERSVAALREVVAELDREALARKRPVTRALASEVLRSRAVGEGGETEDET
ncbi:chromosomal replication initiator protein DnaA [Bosea sp. 117]|uniref:chromosomal replication initiator protein DnaA n=1 Tax=Bosea sp. 117 TaxID=1125973 RepID=UPI000494A927|nr:chromosomal replication initiator protein DnaA [Bosea sp. 117]